MTESHRECFMTYTINQRPRSQQSSNATRSADLLETQETKAAPVLLCQHDPATGVREEVMCAKAEVWGDVLGKAEFGHGGVVDPQGQWCPNDRVVELS